MEKKLHMTRGAQTGLRILLILLFIALAAAAAGVPFFFESQSLYYKFGVQKMLLRVGKLAGLMAMVLILCQVLLISRFRFMAQVFGLKQLLSFHRHSGRLIAGLILLHPLAIAASDGFAFFPLELRYWPEFLGIGLAFSIAAIVLIAVRPGMLGVNLKTARRIHAIATPLIVLGAVIHVFFVSESFEMAIPRGGLALLTGVVLLLFLRLYIRRMFKLK